MLGLAGVTLIGLLILGFAFAPDERGFGTHQQLGLQPCFPMEAWNVPCPGCGVTTSVSLAMHGEFWRSVVNQPFGFAVWLCFVLFVLWAPVAHFRGRDLWADLQRLRYGPVLKAIGVFTAVAWIYKLALVRDWFGG